LGVFRERSGGVGCIEDVAVRMDACGVPGVQAANRTNTNKFIKPVLANLIV
jgi:hypothetical protein